jgi:hypothetical protein
MLIGTQKRHSTCSFRARIRGGVNAAPPLLFLLGAEYAVIKAPRFTIRASNLAPVEISESSPPTGAAVAGRISGAVLESPRLAKVRE